MEVFYENILNAMALVFVIEGLVYALFPEAVKNMMKIALQIPAEQLRGFGMFMALAGVTFVWLIHYF